MKAELFLARSASASGVPSPETGVEAPMALSHWDRQSQNNLY
jgi:hypothetical protein